MIRHIKPSDIPKLNSLQNGFEWTFSNDLIEVLVATDENDEPIIFAGAWKIAETHCLIDPSWSTPGARLLMLEELHEEMRKRLAEDGYKQAVTWFDSAKERFIGRMQGWGWVKSPKVSFHRSTNG